MTRKSAPLFARAKPQEWAEHVRPDAPQPGSLACLANEVVHRLALTEVALPLFPV